MITRSVFLAAVVSCTRAVPEVPSFQQDVMPILAANCVRCHGYPALGGSPDTMRLDVYGDIAVDDTTTISGAASLAELIATRVASDTLPMPPRFPLDDFQIETLVIWAEGVVPGELAPRGAPRADNRPPEIALTRLGQMGTVISIQSVVHDADGDLVVGQIRAAVGGTERIVGLVRSGLVDLHWDATGVLPGDYSLSAHLDDGAQVHSIALGTIRVGGP